MYSSSGSRWRTTLDTKSRHVACYSSTESSAYYRYRIKDPKRSLDFYTRVIGMQLITKLDLPDMKFSLYFLGFHSEDEIPEDPKDRVGVPCARYLCVCCLATQAPFMHLTCTAIDDACHADRVQVEWMFKQPASEH